jgi:flagellar FliJ protein
VKRVKMAFRFRYESLLSYRRHLKEKAEVDLGMARRRLQEARTSLKTDRGRLEGVGKSFESRMKNRMSAGEIKNHVDFLAHLKGRIKVQELNVDRLEGVARNKKEELLKKAKEYKVIEKLKEKDLQAWQQGQLQREQKRMSEVAVTRHGRAFL